MMNIDKDMLAILHDLAGGKEKIEKEKKAYLRKVAKELGIKQPENPRCANCWRDVATLCWIEARMRLEGAEQAAPTGRYVLREGVDVVFFGHRINAATITDELAQNLIEKGFPTKYFVAIPDPS